MPNTSPTGLNVSSETYLFVLPTCSFSDASPSVDMDSHLQSGQDNASPALASPRSFKSASPARYLDTVQRVIILLPLNRGQSSSLILSVRT